MNKDGELRESCKFVIPTVDKDGICRTAEECENMRTITAQIVFICWMDDISELLTEGEDARQQLTNRLLSDYDNGVLRFTKNEITQLRKVKDGNGGLLVKFDCDEDGTVHHTIHGFRVEIIDGESK